jgi:arylsulfatase
MTLTYRDGAPFPGVVGTTLRESVPAWPMTPRPPEGSPNVVVVVLDDVGFAHLSCFGSDIATPNFDRLAARGLRYRSFHTTAMCSPTRACVLTGRNHHTCAIGGITDLALGFPGFNGRIPKSCAFVPAVLRDEGWATFAVGKWHLAPSDETHAAASRDRWPLGQGFERYYGFIGAETSQYAPDLVMDNSPIQFAPDSRGDYHLSVDLVDHAIGMVDDLRNVDPTKPFFMYLAFGACHSPHHAPQDWIDRYRGRFDDGWDAWRARTFDRQRAMGVVPDGAELSPRPSWVQDWETLSAEERRLYARMMEVFAGFLSHTDDQLGRVLDHLERTGELDNTWVIAISDNGASAEGGPFGTFNENFLFNGLPHDLEKTLSLIDELGGPNSYGHYPWGWAFAGNTPFKRWKRETHEGGIGDPFIIAGPGVPADDAGSVRPQYTHAIDIAATLLDACGVEMPSEFHGVAQEPIAGGSILPSVRSADAPEHRRTQYYEQFACRAIYHEGWKAVAFHSMGIVRYEETDNPHSPYHEDRWELYHVAVDPAEVDDLADSMPEKLRFMQDLWFREAGRYGALPLQSARGFAVGRPHSIPSADRYEYRPGAIAVPEDVAVNTKVRPHRIVATIDVPPEGAEGVLLAQGGRFGGFSLYLRDSMPHYTYNFTGLEQTTLAGTAALAPGRHVVAFDSTPDAISADVALYVDGASVAAARIERTAIFRFALHGEGLCCGYDDGTGVADCYESPFAFTGTIEKVVVDVSGDPFVDTEAEIRHAWMTQ